MAVVAKRQSMELDLVSKAEAAQNAIRDLLASRDRFVNAAFNTGTDQYVDADFSGTSLDHITASLFGGFLTSVGGLETWLATSTSGKTQKAWFETVRRA